jgi:hypothetical protein
MYPFPDSGLRLIHNEKVHAAMERARIDVELSRGSRRTVQLSMLSNVFISIHNKLNIFSRIDHLRHRSRAFAKGDRCDSR